MEPELKKTEVQRKSAIENYQNKKDLKQNLFQKNIDQQMQRMNERLKNRRSKSMLAKSRKAEREKSLLQMSKLTGRPRQNTHQGTGEGEPESKGMLDFLEREVLGKSGREEQGMTEKKKNREAEGKGMLPIKRNNRKRVKKKRGKLSTAKVGERRK